MSAWPPSLVDQSVLIQQIAGQTAFGTEKAEMGLARGFLGEGGGGGGYAFALIYRPLFCFAFCPKWSISGPSFNNNRGPQNPSSPYSFLWSPIVCNKCWGEKPFSYLITTSPTLSCLKATKLPAVRITQKADLANYKLTITTFVFGAS